MGDRTSIEWTDSSWNPIRARTGPGVGFHCEIITPGCNQCYAQAINKRLGTHRPYLRRERSNVSIYLDEKTLMQPIRWRKPRKVFVCSMSDLFGEWVPNEMLDRIFSYMAGAHQGHVFQILTKRPERMRDYMRSFRPDGQGWITRNGVNAHGAAVSFADDNWPPKNFWFGVSVEDQRRADERIPLLLDTPAAVRWISAEPLLGPVDPTNLGHDGDGVIDALRGEDWIHYAGDVRRVVGSRNKLDWVVIGGESGPGARPMHPDWARSLREQCLAAEVPFFFKQWGHYVQVDADMHHHDYAAAANGEGRWKFDRVVDPNGTVLPSDSMCIGRRVYMRPVGKKAAGRQLDGREWSEYAEARA